MQVRFASPEALRQEFEKNILNRGVFVATGEAFEVRQTIDVEVVLDYVSEFEVALALTGEIVHRIPPEMTNSGAVPGVAIQLEATAGELREAFEPLLGQQPVADLDADTEGPKRRSARRGAVRVPVRVMPTMSPPFEATSRDLSATGILLSIREHALPIGEIVRVCLWHPSGEPSVEIDGKVVREIENRKGRVAAAAVAFDRNQAADPRLRSVIDALREAGHRSRLGGIEGSLSDLGLANMLQMFGSSAPCGTLVVECEGEQGWIAFSEGHLIGAEVGALSGQDALVAMIDWGDGSFQFEASVDPKLVEQATPRPLAGAVLEAVCALDEREHEAGGGADETHAELEFDLSEAGNEPAPGAMDAGETVIDFGENGGIADPTSSQSVFDDAEPTTVHFDGSLSSENEDTVEVVIEIDDTTTFTVDAEQERISREALDKTELAVLDLARAGMSFERLCEVIPESEDQVQEALEGLVEIGLLLPR